MFEAAFCSLTSGGRREVPNGGRTQRRINDVGSYKTPLTLQAINSCLLRAHLKVKKVVAPGWQNANSLHARSRNISWRGRYCFADVNMVEFLLARA